MATCPPLRTALLAVSDPGLLVHTQPNKTRVRAPHYISRLKINRQSRRCFLESPSLLGASCSQIRYFINYDIQNMSTSLPTHLNDSISLEGSLTHIPQMFLRLLTYILCVHVYTCFGPYSLAAVDAALLLSPWHDIFVCPCYCVGGL